MNPHLANLAERRPELEPLIPDVERAFTLMAECYRNGGKMLLCGNGGSASDAEHWAGELLKGFIHKRPLSESDRALLPQPLGDRLQRGLAAIALTNFPALGTAFANDVDPYLTFAQLIWALGSPGDVLVGISTSGNAVNVRAAMETAKARGIVRIGLSGSTGGAMRSLCDLCICVPATETYLIQELHLPIYHCLSLMLEQEFFG
jgi:D-sedoheptulose 7-phosphate isomerase